MTSATISLPGFRTTSRPGLDGHSKPVYDYVGQVDETDHGFNGVSTTFQRSGPGGEAHGVHELPDSEHLTTGRTPTSAERAGARLMGAGAAAALVCDPEARPDAHRSPETGFPDPCSVVSQSDGGDLLPSPADERRAPSPMNKQRTLYNGASAR